jgi:hypothetical protein
MRIFLIILLFCLSFLKIQAQDRDSNTNEIYPYYKKGNLSFGLYNRVGFVYSGANDNFAWSFELFPHVDYYLFNNFSLGLGYAGNNFRNTTYPEYNYYYNDIVFSCKKQFLNRRLFSHSLQLHAYYGEFRLVKDLEDFTKKPKPLAKLMFQYGVILKPNSTPNFSFSFNYGYGIHLSKETEKYMNFKPISFGVTYHMLRDRGR